MKVTKKMLQERATELGVKWVSRDSVDVLRAKIAGATGVVVDEAAIVAAAEKTVDAGLTGAVEAVSAGADPVKTADELVAAVKTTTKAKAPAKAPSKKVEVTGNVNADIARLND